MAKIRINERINNPTDIESLLSDVGGVVYSRRVRVSSVTQSLKIRQLAHNPTDIESLLSDVGGVVYSRRRREMSVGCDDCRFNGTKECCLQPISIGNNI